MRWTWFFVGAGAGAAAVLVPREISKRRARASRAMLARPMGEDAVAPTTLRTMKLNGVVKLQRALVEAGLAVAETGMLDEQTQLALRSFQEKKGLAPTGLPDYETLRRFDLQPDEVFRRLGAYPLAPEVKGG